MYTVTDFLKEAENYRSQNNGQKNYILFLEEQLQKGLERLNISCLDLKWAKLQILARRSLKNQKIIPVYVPFHC